jgi:hypothetical protein
MKWLFAVLYFISVSSFADSTLVSGIVLDATTHQPIADAIVTTSAGVQRTNKSGNFSLTAGAKQLAVRALGYRRVSVVPPAGSAFSVSLEPFRPKALYLSFYGIGSSKLRGQALDLIDKTELNALVVDVKGDRGMMPFRSGVPDAHGTGC